MNHIHSRQAILDLDLWFRHAETIGQARLNNFLVAATILLATIGVTFQAPSNEAAKKLALALCFLGFALSIAWTYLGQRQSKFHGYLQHLADIHIKNLIDESYTECAFVAIRKLQESQDIKTISPEFRLSKIEKRISSRTFLYVVPLVFAFSFLYAFWLVNAA